LYVYGYASNTLDYFGHPVNKGLFLAKQNSTGEVIWLRQFPDIFGENDLGSYIVTDTLTENVYIAGNFFEPLVIPGGITLTPEEDGSLFIIKFNFNGDNQWAVQEDFISPRHFCLAPDYSGNILLSGTFSDNISIGNTSLTSAGSLDVFISKYNSQGNFQWARRAGGEEIEYVGLISTDASDNIYLTGEFISENITVHNSTITLNEGDGNILFAKLDANGNVLWVTSKANSSMPFMEYYCWPTSIQTLPDGNTYMKGWHGDSTYFDNILLRSPYGLGISYFIAKFDPDGNTIWAKSVDQHKYGFDYNQMDLDQMGNVYWGAQIRDTIHFGNDFTYIPNGSCDLFVAKYLSDGELDWIKTMESETTCWLNSIAVCDEESIYVGGQFYKYLNFNNTALTSLNQHGFVALIGETVGVNEYNNGIDKGLFDLYPNPSSDKTTIASHNSNISNIYIEMMDITGKKVFEKHVHHFQQFIEIDLATISNGVYLVKVIANNQIEVKKLIID
jgi:hypothetical protein